MFLFDSHWLDISQCFFFLSYANPKRIVFTKRLLFYFTVRAYATIAGLPETRNGATSDEEEDYDVAIASKNTQIEGTGGGAAANRGGDAIFDFLHRLLQNGGLHHVSPSISGRF